MNPPLFTAILSAHPHPTNHPGRSHRRPFVPPWKQESIWATDGTHHWDLRQPPTFQEFLDLTAAKAVILWSIPYDLAHHSWIPQPLSVINDALHLGLSPSWSLPQVLEQHQCRGYAWKVHPDDGLPIDAPVGLLKAQGQTLWEAIRDLAGVLGGLLRGREQGGAHILSCAGAVSGVFQRMTARGIETDLDAMVAVHQILPSRLNGIHRALISRGLQDFADNAAVSTFLLRQFGVEVHGDLKDDLKALETSHRPDLAAACGQIRMARKLRALLNDPWLAGCYHNGSRIHPIHIPFAAPTGRTTTILPAVTSLPSALRPLVWARPGMRIIEVDYSGAEIGVAAAAFNDVSAKDLYRTGNPIGEMAKRLFPRETAGLTAAQVKTKRKALYDATKQAVYGSIYGMSAKTLARRMQCSQTEAEQILRVLGREIWPKVEQGLTQLTAAFGADPQYRRIPITAGLYRTVPEPHLNEHRYKFRTLPRNTPIQGLAGHVFRWACVYADRCMSDMGGDLLLPLHDSLIAEVPADRCEEGVTQLSVAMTQAARDVLGFDLDCKAESRGAVAWAKGGDVTTLARFLSDQG